MPSGRAKIGSPPRDADSALRNLVTQAIRGCPKSREQVADELSIRLGQRVSIHMLNDFSSQAKKSARFPGSFIEPFCAIAGDDRLQRLVMGPRLRRLVEFAEHELARECLGRELLRKQPKSRKKKHSGLRIVSSRTNSVR